MEARLFIYVHIFAVSKMYQIYFLMMHEEDLNSIYPFDFFLSFISKIIFQLSSQSEPFDLHLRHENFLEDNFSNAISKATNPRSCLLGVPTTFYALQNFEVLDKIQGLICGYFQCLSMTRVDSGFALVKSFSIKPTGSSS